MSLLNKFLDFGIKLTGKKTAKKSKCCKSFKKGKRCKKCPKG
jgi:hypothetical protein